MKISLRLLRGKNTGVRYLWGLVKWVYYLIYPEHERITRKAIRDGNGFYQSKEWRSLRQKRLSIDRHRCLKCGKKKELQVHHRKGKDFSNRLRDLQTLCKICHGKVHGRKL